MAKNQILTPADIETLKTIFATKDDLQNFATKDDLQGLATKSDVQTIVQKELKPIKKDLTQIKNDLNSTLKYIDEQDKKLERRIDLLPS